MCFSRVSSVFNQVHTFVSLTGFIIFHTNSTLPHQVVQSTVMFTPTLEPCVPFALVGEGLGEGFK